MNIDLRARLDAMAADDMLRHIPLPASASDIIDFSTNDYLGLAADSTLQDEFIASCQGRIPALTASASRLLASAQTEFAHLEQLLASLYGGSRRALLFNSGYHANSGIPAPLSQLFARPLILADRLVHASIIDGIILSRAHFRRFPHADMDCLENILEREAAAHDGIIIIVESVYSMDGDRADIDRLIDLKRRFSSSATDIMLYVDEAHALGVEGPAGLGLVQASMAPEEVDIVVGTFGKALASAGAFALTSADLREWLINRARSFIFSTALPPAQAAWSRFTLERAAEADSLRARLARLAAILDPAQRRYIFPAIVGSAAGAVALSRRLLCEEGMKVLPIRTPTVPAGSERLRISLRATDSEADICRLARFLSTNLPL
ncbi:MAG: aminotransferase class I/II-fold pyridoxal phosphate-dependent enzyme [Pseudoflavonifractor sp.]|nr:aminotransferase class I/II-fold pyridoxal phosphate-dependent enzyme [Alloprevotella sp.]MCM1116736.1 aminotransferase class I/II-fold pyridoxal phosphate-dependent enzyme [Pseudoflavonifractor sp.]